MAAQPAERGRVSDLGSERTEIAGRASSGEPVERPDGAARSIALSDFMTPSALMRPDYLLQSGWFEHAPFAFYLIDILRPLTVVELGTHHGYSYFCFCQAVKALGLGTTCYAIDSWKGDEHAGLYDDDVYDRVVELNARYAGFSTLIRNTFKDSISHFPDRSVDLLHIDGRHFYEDVLEDFEGWLPKVADEGIVLFHDTNVRERGFGVWRMFDELKRRYPTFEFTHGHGLGVLAPRGVPAALARLLNASDAETEFVRLIYSNLGGGIPRQWLCNHYEACLATSATEIGALKSALDAAQAENRAAAAEADAAREAARHNESELAERLAAATQAIDVLHTSISWRLTAPLRAALRNLHVVNALASPFRRRSTRHVSDDNPPK